MSKRERGRQWDGKSRIANDLYRERFNEIFSKKETEEKDKDKDKEENKE
tara:strand:+ start:487 stop:633 length:147 start_codon:yes stop_codon:yes gene_type:complete